MLPYALGGLQSPPDDRDYAAADFLPAHAIAVPAKLDLRRFMRPIRNQGQSPTCGGFSLEAMLGYEANTHTPALDREASPLDGYVQSREMMPPPNGGGGSYPRGLLAIAVNSGVANEADRPYSDHADPGLGPNGLANRALNRIATYAFCDAANQVEIKTAVNFHGIAMVSANVLEGFAYPTNSIISATGASHGGHLFNIVGWDDPMGCWIIRNSWGTGWADSGYGYLPYTYPLWEVAVATGALKEGLPVIPDVPWWVRMFPWMHIPGVS